MIRTATQGSVMTSRFSSGTMPRGFNSSPGFHAHLWHSPDNHADIADRIGMTHNAVAQARWWAQVYYGPRPDCEKTKSILERRAHCGRVRELHDQGWSLTHIGELVSSSPSSVRTALSHAKHIQPIGAPEKNGRHLCEVGRNRLVMVMGPEPEAEMDKHLGLIPGSTTWAREHPQHIRFLLQRKKRGGAFVSARGREVAKRRPTAISVERMDDGDLLLSTAEAIRRGYGSHELIIAAEKDGKLQRVKRGVSLMVRLSDLERLFGRPTPEQVEQPDLPLAPTPVRANGGGTQNPLLPVVRDLADRVNQLATTVDEMSVALNALATKDDLATLKPERPRGIYW